MLLLPLRLLSLLYHYYHYILYCHAFVKSTPPKRPPIRSTVRRRHAYKSTHARSNFSM